jgi:endoglucanase
LPFEPSGSASPQTAEIPGGMIPGVVIIEPDFPELKDSWPFLWYENEYVVDAATTFILAANAAESLAH